MSEEKKKRSKKTIKIILIIAAAAALVLAAVYTLVIKPAQSEDKYIYKESKAVKGNLVKGIMESGTVTLTTSSVDYDLDIEETETEEESSSDDSDDDSTSTHYLEIENVSVTPGQRIAEGDELFSLSQNSIDAVRRNLEEDKADDEIALEEAQAELNVQVLAAKGTQNSSTTASSVASSLYSATVDELNADIESYTAEIQNLQAEVTQLVAERADEDLWTAKKEAQTALTTAKNVYDDTDVTNAAAYVANYEAYTKAKDTYDKAVDAIDTINDSIDDNNEKIMDDQELLTQAQAQLDHKTMEAKQSYQSSAAEGKAASDVYGYTVDSLQETVDEAQTTLDDASDSLSDFESFVGDDGIIRSDGAGLVTAVNYDAGDKLTDTGAMITYVKDGAYTVSIDVSEEDVSSIKIGDSVTIAFSAYPDETYNGTISEISTSSSDTHQTTVSYPVTVAIDGDTSKLYGGMTADVTFVTDETENVVYVSRKAITYDDSGNAFVYVKSGNDYKLSPVTVGFTDGTSIEIKSGVNEGDTVYIATKISGSEDALKETGADQTGGAEGATSATGAAGETGSGSMQGAPSGGSSGSGSGDQNQAFPGGSMPNAQ
ncbi:MAG: efflux RND transporter periplasmic adaptor subunit [Lachnospiraceae bacterium]|nr:efflux RND transporter periplasmic adaptor subunit [Lachnospiraceae bacterium]